MSLTATPLHSVGRALARMGSLRGGKPAPVATGGDSRVAVLSCVEAATEAIRVDQIAGEVGLHANTVRGHLDALLAAGQVTRVPDQRATRGRPHWLYSAVEAATIREFARTLKAELDQAGASQTARVAASTWAEAAPDVRSESLDEAVERVTEALTGFGFDALANPVGDEITLRACPYAPLIQEHPVICQIHAELLGEMLSRTGQPVKLQALDVLPRPGLCVARLRRPDTVPQWSVEIQVQDRPAAPEAPRGLRRK